MKPQEYDGLLAVMKGMHATMDDLKRYLERERNTQRELIEGLKSGIMRREDAHHEIRFDTSVANAEGNFSVGTTFGGCPAISLDILDVGGGSLQIMLPDMADWLAVDTTTRFDNENITHFKLRSTSGVAGTARVRLGAYVGRY